MKSRRRAEWRERRPDRLAVRLLVGTIVLFLLMVIFATDVDDLIYPNSLLGRTLTDVAILFLVIIPTFYFALFRPLFRLIEERRRSEEALKLRAREKGALNAISEVCARELDMERLLARVMDVVLSVFEAQGGWILLLESEKANRPRVLVARGVPPSFGSPATDLCLDCPINCWGEIEQLPQGEITLISECRELPREVLMAAGFGEYVGVLLPVGRQVRAVLNLLWRGPRTLDDADRALLRSMARQLGIAAENAALYTAEQSAREKSDTISAVTLALNQRLDLDAVLGSLFDHLRRLVPFDRTRVILLEGESRLKAQAFFSSSVVEGKSQVAPSRFEVTQDPLVSQVLESRRSLCLPVGSRQRGLNGGDRTDAGRSWLGVPLLVEGEAIGVIALTKEAEGTYEKEQVKVVEAVAAAASVAIANARLFGEVVSGRKKLETVSRKLVDVQETERRHLARELHDEIGQSLTAIFYRLEAAQRSASSPARGALDEAIEITDRTIKAVRDLSLDLRPSLLDDAGLAESLRWYIDRQVQSDTLEVGLSVSPDSAYLPLDIRTACFRVAQEALTNVVRHSQARHARVQLRRNGTRVELSVSDDGRGFDVDAALRRAQGGGSLGILGMQERAELLGGKVVFESGPGPGTTVRAWLPVCVVEDAEEIA